MSLTVDKQERKILTSFEQGVSANDLQHDNRPLQLNSAGITRLHDLLKGANRTNEQFEKQYQQLSNAIDTVLLRLMSRFGELIEQVIAVGEWAREGIDLCGLPLDDVTLQIVLRVDDLPFQLHWQISEEVFSDLRDEDVFIQFRLETWSQWRKAEQIAQAKGRVDTLGIPLLVRE